MIPEKKNTYTHFFVMVFLFVSLYSFFMNPAFVFLGGLHFAMLLWPLSFLVFHPRFFSGWKSQKALFYSWLCVFLYVLFRTLIGGDPGFVFVWFAFLVEVVFVAYILVRVSMIHSVNLESVLLCVASMAGLLSCICLFFPDFNAFAKSIQVSFGEYEEKYSFRGFGIGDGLSFTYGVSLGTLCALGICNLKRQKWFVFFIPIISLAVLVNARVGFIPILLSLLFNVFFSKHLIKNLLRTIVAMLLIIFLWNSYIEDLLPGRTVSWMFKFFAELGEGNKGETMRVLMNTVVFPNYFEEWFLGKGYNVFFSTGSNRTDIGYLIQLCYGGIFYCILLWIMIIRIVVPAYKNMPKSLFWTLTISMLLENYKGDYIGRNSAFCCFVVIMIYYNQLGMKCNTIYNHLSK